MPANAVVHARIDEHIMEEATVVLTAMGLTVPDAFRIMLTRVPRKEALPFEPLLPNDVTIEAMKEARHGNLEPVTPNDLKATLDAGHRAVRATQTGPEARGKRTTQGCASQALPSPRRSDGRR